MMNDLFADIQKNVAKHIQLTPDECTFFESILEIKTVKAKQFLLKEGQVSSELYFVIDGCLKYFNIDNNGVEHISYFAPKDWWMGDMYSQITKLPTVFNINAVMPTTYIAIKIKNLEILFERVPKFERFFRILIEKNWVANQQRMIDLMSGSAEGRYSKFCIRYPSLINTIAQKQIAAYLGITPEFLSKMRGKFAKRK